jgi:hypothetical protein
MRFQRHPIGPHSNGASSQGSHEFALLTTDSIRDTRKLDTVRGINDSRMPILTHDTETTHIDDAVLIAKGRASICLPDFFGSSLFKLVGDELHFVGRKELAFFATPSRPQQQGDK